MAFTLDTLLHYMCLPCPLAVTWSSRGTERSGHGDMLHGRYPGLRNKGSRVKIHRVTSESITVIAVVLRFDFLISKL